MVKSFPPVSGLPVLSSESRIHTRIFFSLAASLIVAALIGCAESKQSQGKGGGVPSKKSQDQYREDDATDAAADSSDDEDGLVDEGEGDAGGAEAGAGEEFDDFSAGAADAAEAAVQEEIRECGAEGMLDAPPDEVLYEKRLKSQMMQTSVFTIDVTSQVTLGVNVTPARTIQDSKVDILSVDGFLSIFAKGTAEDEARAKSGRVVIENVLPKDHTDLGTTHKAWEGVTCTFVGATRLVSERGGIKTIVSFDPPLPMSLSPKPIAERFESDIGDGRVFSDMKVTIEQTGEPALAGMKTITGKVTVQRVDPQTTIRDASGRSVPISGDLAYKMTYEFGSSNTTFLLGLQPEVTYYVSHAKRDLVANIVDTKQPDAEPLVFVHN